MPGRIHSIHWLDLDGHSRVNSKIKLSLTKVNLMVLVSLGLSEAYDGIIDSQFPV